MKEARRIELSPDGNWLCSLCWAGDELVDFGGGIVRYGLDGKLKRKWGVFAASFDRAVYHKKGDYAITYESLGTKGIVLKGDQIIREINRSYYHAGTYVYPVAIFEWLDGRTVIAHCPEKYCRLEIEEIESGKRVVSRESESIDFFHSRLVVSPDGRYLMSAGWVWQPWDVAALFDLKAVAQRPELLDSNQLGIAGIEAEETVSATFLNSNKVLFSGLNTDNPKVKYLLGIYDLISNKTEFEVEIEEAAGVLMPLGDHVVTFYGHPRLREIQSGKIVKEWPDIASGTQWSSILNGVPKPMPLLALDPLRKRFAVGTKERITVIELE
jgi:hypothetical protein